MKRAVGALAALAAIAACGASSYPFQGRRFDSTLMCLDPYTGIDVISGSDPGGGCAVVCLSNAGAHYLSQECPPYPPLFGVVAADAGTADPTCAAAFAAFARGATCDLDGGVTYPDGGADADASDAAHATDANDAAPTSDAASD